ncbi:enoyl-CoA hydratase/isomerase family protein [Mesorhizobium sp. 8]|uniref:enoyl-CoA hydratase/isomerase family protein n=1 Tax=Mesorhizobium sp. 8 TaxID=2584466 RepID=UPI001122322E|nr:enoyl-CoA hydratase/isomerase family protein [Mesorhizobium sp. 8]QDB99480.1 enoyl-CoA hydratase/isomerase family protein [Mesorhizobium sp. 8]
MPIKYEKHGEIATFTIENGSVNPLTPAMHLEMLEALRDFTRDRSIKVGILKGAGDRAFCAGDDVKTPRPPTSDEDRVLRHFFGPESDTDFNYPGFEREVLTLRRFKPIIGAVKGWCLGEGLFYLLHLTDIRVAGESAKFGFPEIAYEMAGASGFTRLYRHLPRTVAMKMLMTGDPIDAVEAARCNLVNDVVPDTQVLERAEQIAARISRHTALAIRLEMEAFVRGEDLDSNTAYAMADHLYRIQRMKYRDWAGAVEFESEGKK